MRKYRYLIRPIFAFIVFVLCFVFMAYSCSYQIKSGQCFFRAETICKLPENPSRKDYNEHDKCFDEELTYCKQRV